MKLRPGIGGTRKFAEAQHDAHLLRLDREDGAENQQTADQHESANQNEMGRWFAGTKLIDVDRSRSLGVHFFPFPYAFCGAVRSSVTSQTLVPVGPVLIASPMVSSAVALSLSASAA